MLILAKYFIAYTNYIFIFAHIWKTTWRRFLINLCIRVRVRGRKWNGFMGFRGTKHPSSLLPLSSSPRKVWKSSPRLTNNGVYPTIRNHISTESSQYDLLVFKFTFLVLFLLVICSKFLVFYFENHMKLHHCTALHTAPQVLWCFIW